MHLGEVEWDGVNWINFLRDREKVQAVLNIAVDL
jgi:hypothetical protein